MTDPFIAFVHLHPVAETSLVRENVCFTIDSFYGVSIYSTFRAFLAKPSDYLNLIPFLNCQDAGCVLHAMSHTKPFCFFPFLPPIFTKNSGFEQFFATGAVDKHTHTHFQEGPCLDLVTPVVSKWRKGRITTNISCDPQIMVQYQEDTTGYQKKTRLQKRHHCWERLPRQNDVIYLHEVCTVYLRKKILYIHIYHDRWWIMNHDGINT